MNQVKNHQRKFNIDISFCGEDKLLFVTDIERIHTYVRYNLRQTNFKDFSRICQGQITIFKDWYLFNKSAFFNRPLLNILLAKSRHGVMYNFTSSAMVDRITKYATFH